MKSLILRAALLATLVLSPSLAHAQGKPNNPDKPPVDEPSAPEPTPTPAPPTPDPTPAPPTPDPAPPQPDPAPPPLPDPQTPEFEYRTLAATYPQSILDALTAEGFRGEFGTTKSGRTKITFKVAGGTTGLYFYDCKKDMTGCRSLQFLYGIDLTDGAKLSQVNDWNGTQLWGKAYLDGDGDPWLALSLNTGDILPAVRFSDALDTWELLVGKFKAKFVTD